MGSMSFTNKIFMAEKRLYLKTITKRVNSKIITYTPNF